MIMNSEADGGEQDLLPVIQRQKDLADMVKNPPPQLGTTGSGRSTAGSKHGRMSVIRTPGQATLLHKIDMQNFLEVKRQERFD